MSKISSCFPKSGYAGNGWVGLVALVWMSLVVSLANAAETGLRAEADEAEGEIRVYQLGQQTPILTQVARPDFRPYLHPIRTPDGQGVITESQPDHHPHQTGLYWGFTRVNGRDFFHHPGAEYWRRVSMTVLKPDSVDGRDGVQWQTVYDLLAADGRAVLRESQIWTLRLDDPGYVLDLQWSGDAQVDVTIGEYDYGGLFVRMPWRQGVEGRVLNSVRQENERAEGQRAVWVDVGVQLEGRQDLAHIAVFDHPSNDGFPQPWRVDGQLGVGPVRARLGDWTIQAGRSVGFRHRLLIYSGELGSAELTDHWSKFSGQDHAWAQWHLARQQGREAKFLSPDEAVEAMTVQNGFEVNVFAAEPIITQPMAFCWDDRGRLWIAENRDYEDRKTGFSAGGDSRILILEDTDRDGVADQRTVFAEGIPFPAAIATGLGGLWLGAPPNLMFIPDTDGDDRGDLDAIQVRLTGWGIRDRHETLNSLHWGPDGWLYGLQGFATPSTVGKPAGKGRVYRPGEAFPHDIEFAGETTEINGGVWRYHPTKDRFEVVAHGFSNPWGIDYDAHGQLFITACVIPHLWHVIPGGIYHRQGGSHFNPYIYDDIKTIADHRHRSAHGGARVYQSDAFPEPYRGRLFMANIHEHAVLTDVLEPEGSGFVGVHGDDFLLANNAQWVGFGIEIGPDGAVYVLDWHDADICGADVLNQDTGRIFRVAPTDSQAKDFPDRYMDLRELTDQRLVELQSHESSWHARRARTILQHRSASRNIDSGAVEQLERMLDDEPRVPVRLRALWSLHLVGELSDIRLTALLGDPQPYLRGWAIQLLCEDLKPPSDAITKFVTMASSDPSPVVRLYLAAALQRMDTSSAWMMLEQLVQHPEDANDHNLPKMIWFALEPLVEPNPAAALRLATKSQIPLVTRHIARRLADAGQLEELVDLVAQTAESKLEFANTQRPTPPATDRVRGEPDAARFKATELLLGMRDSLEGRFEVAAPVNWSATVPAIESLGEFSSQLALQLSQQFGDASAANAMLMLVRNPAANNETRRTAIAGLAGQKNPKLVAELPKLLDDAELRSAAIRASASFESTVLTEQLLARYPNLSDEEQLDVVLALASRSESGRALTAAIARGEIPRSDIPAYVARLLQRVVGNGFIEVWGPLESLAADQAAAFGRYRQLLTPAAVKSADVDRGRALFKQTCYACHRLHGEGGQVGPDITGANRGNLEYLLGNILTPSAEIQDAYRMQVMLTDDGRVYAGIPVEENERVVRLRVANEDALVTIAKSAIESRQVAAVSMMPDGILNELTDEDVVALFGYLQMIAAPAP